MAKVAIAVFADTETHGDLGRIANALTMARGLKAANDEVTIIFDGAGTKWVRELSQPDHRLHGAFESVKDKVGGACSYCAAAFGVKKDVEASGIRLLADFEDHPSIKALVDQEYEVITL